MLIISNNHVAGFYSYTFSGHIYEIASNCHIVVLVFVEWPQQPLQPKAFASQVFVPWALSCQPSPQRLGELVEHGFFSSPVSTSGRQVMLIKGRFQELQTELETTRHKKHTRSHWQESWVFMVSAASSIFGCLFLFEIGTE